MRHDALGADPLDRLRRRGGLGHAPRRTLADAEDLAVDPDLDAERLLVVRAGRVQQAILRSLTGAPLRVLLQPALGALQAEERRLQRELRRGEPDQPVPDEVVAEVQVEGAGQRLERRCEQRRSPPAAALGFAFAKQEVRAEVDAAGEARKAGGRDDRRTARGERAFIVVGMPRVQGLGDGEVHDGIAQELESLVVPAGGLGMLVEPTGMDECLLQQVKVPDREAEPLRDGLSPSHRRRG